MKKNILLLLTLALIITAFLIYQSHNKDNVVKEKVYNEVGNNYNDLMSAIGILLKYKPADRFYLAEDSDVDINNKLTVGDLYVEHNTDQDLGYFTPVPIHDGTIQQILKLEGIDAIIRNKDTIIFQGDDQLSNMENGFCGFYYSLTGEPKTVLYFEDTSLKKEGKGWSVVEDEKYSKYYTEKIKGSIYYYEGVFFP